MRKLLSACVLVPLLLSGCASSEIDLSERETLAGTWTAVEWPASVEPFTLTCKPTVVVDEVGLSGSYTLEAGAKKEQGTFVALPDSREIVLEGKKRRGLHVVSLSASTMVVSQDKEGRGRVVLTRK